MKPHPLIQLTGNDEIDHDGEDDIGDDDDDDEEEDGDDCDENENDVKLLKCESRKGRSWQGSLLKREMAALTN